MSFKKLLHAQVDEWLEEFEQYKKENNNEFINHHWNDILKNMQQQRNDLFSDPKKLPEEVQLTEKELKFKHDWKEQCIQEVDFLLTKSNELNKEQLERIRKQKEFYETLDSVELDQFIMFHGLIEYNEHQQIFGGNEEDSGSYYLKSVYTDSVMYSVEESLIHISTHFI